MSETRDISDGLATDSSLSVETILSSIPDAVVVAEFGTNEIVAANAAAADLFECRVADLVGLDRQQLHPQEDAGAYEEAFHRGFESEQVTRLEDGRPLYIETAGGDRKPVEINAQRIQSGDSSLVLGVFRDVSDRLEREQELRETTTKLETLLNATPLPVAVTDTDGIVTSWNQAATETFGYTAEEVVGTPFPLFVDDAEFERYRDRILNGGVLDGVETVYRAKDGSRVGVEMYARPLYEDGEVTGSIGCSVEIGDRRHRRRQLDLLHRLLRHNLRNKLSVIQGYASSLAADAPDGSQTARDLEKVLQATRELAELSNEARQSRRLVTEGESSTEPVGLVSVLATVTDGESTGTTPRLRAETVDETATIPAEASQALSGLLDCITEYVDGPTVNISVDVQRRNVLVTISAETALLSAGDRELVTNGRETALQHGSGLGVARAYLALTALGGEVTFCGEQEQTRAMEVDVPRADT